MYKGHYKIEDLKKKVLNEGYSKKDIDDALNQLAIETKGNNPPTLGSTINKINNMNFEDGKSGGGQSIKKVSKPMKVVDNSKKIQDDNKKIKNDNKKIKVKNNKIVKKPKSWVVALILSLFLGILGIDRFYMGYIGTGILKLITFGGLGVWYLVDIILIAIKLDFAKVMWE